jgi:hypothetical protein
MLSHSGEADGTTNNAKRRTPQGPGARSGNDSASSAAGSHPEPPSSARLPTIKSGKPGAHQSGKAGQVHWCSAACKQWGWWEGLADETPETIARNAVAFAGIADRADRIRNETATGMLT